MGAHRVLRLPEVVRPRGIRPVDPRVRRARRRGRAQAVSSLCLADEAEIRRREGNVLAPDPRAIRRCKFREAPTGTVRPGMARPGSGARVRTWPHRADSGPRSRALRMRREQRCWRSGEFPVQRHHGVRSSKGGFELARGSSAEPGSCQCCSVDGLLRSTSGRQVASKRVRLPSAPRVGRGAGWSCRRRVRNRRCSTRATRRRLLPPRTPRGRRLRCDPGPHPKPRLPWRSTTGGGRGGNGPGIARPTPPSPPSTPFDDRIAPAPDPRPLLIRPASSTRATEVDRPGPIATIRPP